MKKKIFVPNGQKLHNNIHIHKPSIFEFKTVELLNNKKSPRKQARRKAFPIHHRTMTWKYQTNAKLVCTEKNRKRLWTRGRVHNINVQYELVMRTEMHDVLWGQISQSCSTLIARYYSLHQFQWHIYNRKHVSK